MVAVRTRKRFKRWAHSVRKKVIGKTGKKSLTLAKKRYGRRMLMSNFFYTIPPKYTCKLKFNQRITSASMKDGDLVLYGNNPNRIFYQSTVDGGNFGTAAGQFTGAGHYGYAQYIDRITSFYAQAIILGSKIKIKAVAAGSGTTGRLYAIYPDTVSTPDSILDPDSVDNIMSKRGSKWAINTGNTASNGVLVKNYATTKYMYNMRDVKDSKEDFSALLAIDGVGPDKPWFWHIREQSLDQATASGSWIYLTMTFYVMFWDTINPEQYGDPEGV